ncbi:hypothetical protein [Sphingobacterium kyonggiense]
MTQEFKGTKGEWSIEPTNKKGAWIGNENGYSALSCGNTDKEASYNAQLISCAPEMLEMLIGLKKNIEKMNGINNVNWLNTNSIYYEALIRLITKATTI